MAYQRKTIDRWDIMTNYGYGWECEAERHAAELEELVEEYEARIDGSITQPEDYEPLTEAEQDELNEAREELEAIQAKLDNGEAHQGRKDKEMKKIISDGWHECGAYDLYIEDGRILRGTTKGWNARAVYPYKRCRTGGWVKGTPLYSTYRRSSAWKMM